MPGAGQEAGAAVQVEPETAAATPPAARGERFRSLDGVRALAAIAVLFTHAAAYSSVQHGVLADYLSQFNIAVAVFFGLSGFLLYRPFVLAHLKSTSGTPIRTYATRRLARIYPAYWAALAVAVYGLGLWQFQGRRNTLFGFSLLQLYGGSYVQGLPQAWTLCVEISFYAFLPVYAFVLRRCARRHAFGAELVGVATIAAVGLGLTIARFAKPDMPGWTIPPRNGAVFAAGMLLAVLHARREARGGLAWLDRVGRSAFAGVALATVAFLMVVHVVNVRSDRNTTPHQELGRYLLEIVIVLGLLVPSVFGPTGKGLVRRFLRHPVMAYLGMISYGIYLWHDPIMVVVHDRWFGWGNDQGNLAVVAALGLALTLVVASVSWYVLERPIIRWTQRLPSRRSGPRAAKPSASEPTQAQDALLERSG
jgi:peptidoglycan/LPS O-acetylase OafA/YrhL